RVGADAADLELRSAGELDAEDEASAQHRDDDRDDDEHGGDGVPEVPAAHEVDRRASGVEVVAPLGEVAHQDSRFPAASAALRSAMVCRRCASRLLDARFAADTATGSRN